MSALNIYGHHHWELGGGQQYLDALAAALRELHSVRILPFDRPEMADIVQSNERSFGPRMAYVMQIPYSPINLKSVYGKLRRGEIRDTRRDFGRKRLLRALRKSGVVLVYSDFVRRALDRHGIYSMVLYPPVADFGHGVKPKGNKILSVGRFFKKHIYNHKRYETLIDAFKSFCSYKPGWEYHIVGGLAPEEYGYLAELEARAEGYPVFFHPNEMQHRLRELYETSTIFWHGAGYNAEGPEECEHFGVSVAEAMTAGCIPFVPPAGGPEEIVDGADSCGLYWHTPSGLAAVTIQYLSYPERIQAQYRYNAKERGKFFSWARFKDSVHRIFTEEFIESWRNR
jgi:glycosyltransferase involved in cell wall biosynthesis